MFRKINWFNYRISLEFKRRLVLLALIFIVPAGLHAEQLQTVEIKRTVIDRLVHLDGVVEAIHKSTLTAQTSGQIKALLFDVDDFVESGQEIILLDDTEQKASVKQAEANLKAAKAGLQDAKKEFDRVQTLSAKKLVAVSELDKARFILDKAQAGLNSALASLEQAQKQLDYTRVTAPFSGLVTQRHIQVGETAQPGIPLISGISLDQIRIVVDVPQTLISSVRKEKKAMVEMPGGEWIPAEKLTIFPIAEETSNTFKVRLDLAPGIKQLLPGMFVKVAFVTGQHEVLLVPSQSVVYRSEVTGVYSIDKTGSVMFRHVRVGHMINDRGLIVLSGLLEHERVALDPVAAGSLLKHQRQK